MWKVSITLVEADPETSVALVTFEYNHSDGIRKDVRRERVSDISFIKKIANDHLRELERIDAVTAFISNPRLEEITFEAPVLKPEEERALNYNKEKNELVALKQDLDLRLISQEEYDEKVLIVKQAK